MNRLLDLNPSADTEPEWYTGCKVLVTSRPIAARIDDARGRSDANYELVGFDSAQMQNFVERCLQLNTTPSSQGVDGIARVAELCRIIAADSSLTAACQTAYTLAMICAAYGDDRGMFISSDGKHESVSVKLTDIYLRMARKTALSNVLHRGLLGGAPKGSKLSPQQRQGLVQGLSDMARLAVSGFGSPVRLEFTAAEVHESLRDLGLLTSFKCITEEDPLTGEIETENRYSFDHLTVQEFFTAWSLTGPAFDQVDAVVAAAEMKATDPRWHVVLRFAIGLLRQMKDKDAGLVGAARAVKKLAERGNQQAKYPDGSNAERLTVIPGVLALCLQCVAEADGATVMLGAIEGLLMKEVDLENQGLTNVELGALGKALPMLGKTGPTSLNLKCNQFGAEGLHQLTTGVASITVAVTHLHLGSNSIDDAGGRHIADMLKLNRTLATLELGSNQIGNSSAKQLANALKSNTTLASLILYSNQIGDAGAAQFANTLKSNTTLTKLDLAENPIGGTGAERLSESLKHNTSLSYLALQVQDNKIEAEIKQACARNMTSSIRNGKDATTTELGLSNFWIDDNLASGIADMLRGNTTLTSILLDRNQIGTAGAKQLAIALELNRTLVSLILYSNQIGDEGAKQLAVALNSNTTLRMLNLSRCEIGNVGAGKLAEMLRSNITLTVLGLRDNQIGDAGASLLAEALSHNTNVTVLALSGNQIEDAQIDAKVHQALRRNCITYGVSPMTSTARRKPPPPPMSTETNSQ